MALVSGSGQMTQNGLSRLTYMRRNLYYLIWADAITSYRKHHPNQKNWQFRLLFLNSWIHALNLWIIYIWLKFFDVLTIPLIRVNLFPGDLLDEFLSFTIEFALPFIVVNYFLVFHNKRYERIVKRIDNLQYRYVLIYSYVIAIVAFISALLYGLLY